MGKINVGLIKDEALETLYKNPTKVVGYLKQEKKIQNG